jgi:hypothetical protein
MVNMKKVTDLSATELDALARDAWSSAAQRAFALGHPVTGSRDGRRIRYFPDGHIEDLGPVADVPEDDHAATQDKSGRSVA